MGDKTTAGGITPGIDDTYHNPEGMTEWSVIPSGFLQKLLISRGFTPACSLTRPSAFKVGNFS